MNDESLMPFGKYKNNKLANVPASYLLWLLTEGKITGDLKKYIEDNKAGLEIEVSKSRLNKR